VLQRVALRKGAAVSAVANTLTTGTGAKPKIALRLKNIAGGYTDVATATSAAAANTWTMIRTPPYIPTYDTIAEVVLFGQDSSAVAKFSDVKVIGGDGGLWWDFPTLKEWKR
jgi:hypothetical protein